MDSTTIDDDPEKHLSSDSIVLRILDPSSNGNHVNAGFEEEVSSVIFPQQSSVRKTEGTPRTPSEIKPEDGPKQERWGHPTEFLMSCISLSVGLGNIWRFPYTAYNNGGGAFLIPYLIVLTFIGRPIYFLEISLGQFSSSNQVHVWKISPVFKGVGYGSSVANLCVMSYYITLLGMTIYYLYSSVQNPLPWAVCDEDWINLGSGIVDRSETVRNKLEPKFKCNHSDPAFVYHIEGGHKSNTSVSQLFFENRVLKQKYQIDDGLGSPDWRLMICLFVAWLLIWGAIVKGVEGSGKVAYFTAIFPYVVLLIMFIRGVSLPHAWKGIKYFLKPDWEKMKDAKIWFEAVNQCFFSLATTFGPLIMFGSFNDFKHNTYRDAWIVSCLDTFTSLFAGVIVFAVLGNLAGELGVEVKDVTRGDAGLSFVSFAQALGTFTFLPQVFSVLFYLMLLTLGVGSGVATAQALVSVVSDGFPNLRKWMVVSLVCVVGFLAGIMYVTPGGMFLLDLVSHFGVDYVIYLMALMEIIAIAWVYGVNNFMVDLEFMLGMKLGWYWKICWAFTIPLGLTTILVYSLATEERWTLNGLQVPDRVISSGWIVAAFGVGMIPAWALFTIVRMEGKGIKEKLRNSIQPREDWGPKDPSLRQEWQAFKVKKAIKD